MDKHQMLALAGLPLIFWGVWINWRMPMFSSDVEEAVKDRKLTPEQARRRMVLLHQGCTVIIVAGLVMLAVGLDRMGLY